MSSAPLPIDDASHPDPFDAAAASEPADVEETESPAATVDLLHTYVRQIDVAEPARGGSGGDTDVAAAGADPLNVDDGEAFEGAGKGVLHVLVFGAESARRIPHRR